MRLIDRILGQRGEKAQSANTDSIKPEWKTVKVYLYRADGKYPAPKWAETPQAFNDMITDIHQHVENKLEVRITNGDDHLLFHTTKDGVQWDGIGLSRFLEHDREAMMHTQGASGKSQPALSPTDSHKGQTQTQQRSQERSRGMER